MVDELQFICEECGKHFAPDPDTMRELFLGPDIVSEDEAEAAIESGEVISREDLESLDAEGLADIGLTPDQRDALIRGEEVAIGGICICKECQDRLEAEHGCNF